MIAYFIVTHHTFICSYSTEARSEIAKFGTDARLGGFIGAVPKAFNEARAVVEDSQETATELLKSRPSNIHRKRSDAIHERKEMLHYVFDGLLPFLSAVFERHWNSTVPIPHPVIQEILGLPPLLSPSSSRP